MGSMTAVRRCTAADVKTLSIQPLRLKRNCIVMERDRKSRERDETRNEFSISSRSRNLRACLVSAEKFGPYSRLVSSRLETFPKTINV